MTTALTTPPAPARMTRANSDETLIASWLRLKDSPATKETYLAAIIQFMDWYAHRPLQTLTHDDLADYKEHLATLAGSRATQAIRLNAVKSLLTYGFTVGYLPFNVGKSVKAAKVPNTLARRILEEWQVMALLNHPALRPRDRLLLRLLYASGGRVSEIVNLKWSDLAVNGDSGQITVTGKGDETRAIKLSVDTWKVLQAFRPMASQLNDYVFQSQRRRGQEGRNGRMDRTAVNRIVRRAGRLIGVPNLSPHWLRHAHASHALDHGATVAVVKETLGHSSIAVTSRYLHARPGESSALKLGV